MDAKIAAGIQRDEQAEGSPETAIRTQVEAILKDTHTCLPGIIRSFDAETQTAQVQPAIKRLFIEEGPVDLPLCVDVPVQFPQGGNFILTFPVGPPDECLLVFSERAIDFWWHKGGVQLPAEYRMHDLSDAFAIVGVRNRTRAADVADFSTDAAELRTRDGTTVLRIEGSSIYVGGKLGAEAAIMGETYLQAEDVLLTGIIAGVNAALGALGLGAASTTLNGLKETFDTAAATFLASKAKVV